MHSLPSFDRAYPVRTLYTDNEDWRRCEGWQDADRRKAALQDYLRVPLKQVIYARETHSGSVFAVSSETGGSLAIKKETFVSAPLGGYDALVTDVSGLLLCIWTADCVPLFLYDTTKQVAAVAHCGWRGILDGIVPKTVRVMAERFGAAPEHIIAGFGPAICGKCYVVSEDLHEPAIPYEEILPVIAESDFDGYIVSEFEDEGGYDSVEQVRRHIRMMNKILGK